MSDASHSRAPRLSRRRSCVAAVVAIGLGAVLPLASAPAPASAKPSFPVPETADASFDPSPRERGIEGQLTAEIVLHDSGVVTQDAPLVATVLLTNRTESVASAGEISLHIDDETIDTRYDLGTWSNSLEVFPDYTLGTEVERAPVEQVHPGSTLEIPITLPDSLAALDGSAFGARGMTVQWHTDAGVVAQGRSTIVLDAETLANPVSISPIVPIVADLAEGDLFSITELQTLTAADGDLSLLLDAVEGTEATLAIDPRVLVSIRALGADAPQVAVAWLERLEALDNPNFPLEFADASFTLQQQAGLSAPLEPTGFSYVTSQHEFFTIVQPDATQTPSPTASTPPTESGTPDDFDETPPVNPDEAQPETGAENNPAVPETGDPANTDPASTEPEGSAPETAEPVLTPRPAPEIEELLAFDYSRPNLSWPAAGTVVDVAALTEWGAGSIVLHGDQATHSPDRSSTPSSQQQIAGTEVLVTDAELDAAISNAVTADDNFEFLSATTDISALLAVIARELPNETREIVTTLPRTALDDPQQLGELLDQIDAHSWSEIAKIPGPSAEPTSLAETELVPASYSDDVVTQFQELLEANQRGLDLTALYNNPLEVAEEQRVAFISAISNSVIRSDQWDDSRASFVELATAAADQITISEGSEIQLIGHESSLPLFIENHTDREVTVEVQLRPTTGHLNVTESTVVTISAGGVTRASLPVQAIANGVSGVEATLWTTTKVPLNNSAEFVVNVNASLETVAVGLLIGAGAVLFVVGIWRTLRRRKRERASEVKESDG